MTKTYLLRRFNNTSNSYEFLSSNGVNFYIAADYAERAIRAHLFTLDDAIEWMRRIPHTSIVSTTNERWV